MGDSNDPLRVLCFAFAVVMACGAVAYWNVAGPNAPMFTVCAVGFTFLAALLPHAGATSRSDNSRTEVTNNIYTAAPAPQPAAYHAPMQAPQVIVVPVPAAAPAASSAVSMEMLLLALKQLSQGQAQASTHAAVAAPVAAESRYMGNVIDVASSPAPMLLLPTDRRHLTAQPEPASMPMRLLQRMKS